MRLSVPPTINHPGGPRRPTNVIWRVLQAGPRARAHTHTRASVAAPVASHAPARSPTTHLGHGKFGDGNGAFPPLDRSTRAPSTTCPPPEDIARVNTPFSAADIAQVSRAFRLSPPPHAQIKACTSLRHDVFAMRVIVGLPMSRFGVLSCLLVWFGVCSCGGGAPRPHVG